MITPGRLFTGQPTGFWSPPMEVTFRSSTSHLPRISVRDKFGLCLNSSSSILGVEFFLSLSLPFFCSSSSSCSGGPCVSFDTFSCKFQECRYNYVGIALFLRYLPIFNVHYAGRQSRVVESMYLGWFDNGLLCSTLKKFELLINVFFFALNRTNESMILRGHIDIINLPLYITRQITTSFHSVLYHNVQFFTSFNLVHLSRVYIRIHPSSITSTRENNKLSSKNGAAKNGESISRPSKGRPISRGDKREEGGLIRRYSSLCLLLLVLDLPPSRWRALKTE